MSGITKKYKIEDEGTRKAIEEIEEYADDIKTKISKIKIFERDITRDDYTSIGTDEIGIDTKNNLLVVNIGNVLKKVSLTDL